MHVFKFLHPTLYYFYIEIFITSPLDIMLFLCEVTNAENLFACIWDKNKKPKKKKINETKDGKI
jgi:hypothetical protein